MRTQLYPVLFGGASGQSGSALLRALNPTAFYTMQDASGDYQDDAGGSLATIAGQDVQFKPDSAQFGGASFSGFVAGQAEQVTNGTFDADLTGWTDLSTGSGSASVVGAALQIVRVDASNTGWLTQAITTVAGRTYHVTFDRTSGSGAAFRVGTSAGGNEIYDQVASAGANVVHFVAQGVETYIGFRGAINGSTTAFDNVSVKAIPGNHATQASTSLCGKLQTVNGRRVLRTDGTDDYHSGGPTPTAAGAIFLLFTPDSGSAGDAAIGSQPASNGKCYAAIASDGAFAAGIGTQTTSTIKGTTDIRGGRHACWAIWTGSTVILIVDDAVEYQAAQSGAVNTTVAMMLAALNNNGSAVANCDADFEIAAVLNTAPSITAAKAISAAYLAA